MFHPIYSLGLVIITIFAYIEFNETLDFKTLKKIYITVFICIFLLVGFRSFQGTDTEAYYRLYTDALQIPFLTTKIFDQDIEPGYIWLCQIAGMYKLTFLAVIVPIAFFSIGTKMYSYLEHSPYIFLSLLIYYSNIYGEFNQIRQILAIGLCLFSFRYIINNNFIKFFLVVYLAFLFHKSALVFLPVYFFSFLIIIYKDYVNL